MIILKDKTINMYTIQVYPSGKIYPKDKNFLPIYVYEYIKDIQIDPGEYSLYQMDELRTIIHWKIINMNTEKETVLYIPTSFKYKKRKRYINNNDDDDDRYYLDQLLSECHKEGSLLDDIKQLFKKHKDILLTNS